MLQSNYLREASFFSVRLGLYRDGEEVAHEIRVRLIALKFFSLYKIIKAIKYLIF